jgi:hypothetical protein
MKVSGQVFEEKYFLAWQDLSGQGLPLSQSITLNIIGGVFLDLQSFRSNFGNTNSFLSNSIPVWEFR